MAEFNLGALSTNPKGRNDKLLNTDLSDLYSFSLGNVSDLNLALTGMSKDADVELYRDTNSNGILEPGDRLIESSATSGDEAINLNSQAAGSYLVNVVQEADLGTNNYSLKLSNSNPSNLLPTEFEVGSLVDDDTQYFNDDVGGTDAADVYHFSLDSQRNFNLSLDGLSADADVRLIKDSNHNLQINPNVAYPDSPRGEVKGISYNGGSSSESISASLTAGDYFVQVYQYNLGNDTSYDLSMTATV